MLGNGKHHCEEENGHHQESTDTERQGGRLMNNFMPAKLTSEMGYGHLVRQDLPTLTQGKN